MKRILAFTLFQLCILLSVHAQMQVDIIGLPDVTCAGTCQAIVGTSINGGLAPYTHLWDDPSGQTTPWAEGLCSGPIGVMVIDANGDTAYGVSNVIEVDSIVIDAIVNPASCGGLADGSIELNVTGGQPGFSYQWSNGSVNSDIMGLAPGYYQVNVTDYTCFKTKGFQVTEGGLESSIGLTSINPCAGAIGLEANVSGGNGMYHYDWSSGDTTVSTMITGTSIVSLTVSDDSSCTSTSYAHLPAITGQMESYVGGWLNRGFCRFLNPLIINSSCQPFVGEISITLDPNLNLNAGTIIPVPDNVVGNTVTWQQVTLMAGDYFLPEIETCVPLSVQCGDTSFVEIAFDGNTQTHWPVVLCSYDPNDKQVSPKGSGVEGYIQNTEKLTYMVRFQNTGTAPATFIHILDYLDENIDILSLEVLASSHQMVLGIHDRQLDFFFENINLPDSASDLAGSQGFVIYSVDMAPGLSTGTVVENTAHIYFDYNPPIVTNTTVNTIDNLVGLINVEKVGLNVYPNPSTDHILLTGVKQGDHIEIVDVRGGLVKAVQMGESGLIDVSNFNSGIYVLRVIDSGDASIGTSRFIKID